MIVSHFADKAGWDGFTTTERSDTWVYSIQLRYWNKFWFDWAMRLRGTRFALEILARISEWNDEILRGEGSNIRGWHSRDVRDAARTCSVAEVALNKRPEEGAEESARKGEVQSIALRDRKPQTFFFNNCNSSDESIVKGKREDIKMDKTPSPFPAIF